MQSALWWEVTAAFQVRPGWATCIRGPACSLIIVQNTRNECQRQPAHVRSVARAAAERARSRLAKWCRQSSSAGSHAEGYSSFATGPPSLCSMGASPLPVRTDRQQAADDAPTDTYFLLQAQDVEDSSDDLSDQSDSFESVDSAGSEEADRWVWVLCRGVTILWIDR